MIGRLIGPYKLTGEIGFGGMGVVYQATNTETGQTVALKLMSPEYLTDLGLRAAFEREAQLVTSLTHEAIVPVYEFGLEGGQPYLVMQYMPNGSLADRLFQGALEPEEIEPILDRICQAIDYAHNQGVVHRDLKPSNILFNENDRAYLADFGIAWLSTSHQASLPVNGTPAYLSPEQALGDEEVDGRCDIYALGIVLFESLTGVRPFDGPIPLAVLLKQIHDQAPSLRSVDWDLPAGLDDVVQRALAKDPADRFSTAEELARAYRRALSGEPEESRSVLAPDQSAEQSQDGPYTGPETDTQHGEPTTGDSIPSAPSDEDGSRGPQPEQINFLNLRQTLASGGWGLAHLVTLGLATFLGLFLAAGLTAFLHLPQREALLPKGFIGVQLSFDRASLVLINRTQDPLDLSELSFRRITREPSLSAEFHASSWAEAVSAGQPTLPPGACYQLLLPDAPGFSLRPGRPLPTIPGCNNLQGWLIVPEPQSWFWVAEGDADSFEVVWKGTVIQTCPIETGSCHFRVGTP